MEKLLNKADMCEARALKKKDKNLQAFWHNASVGFKTKASELKVSDAKKEVFYGKGN